MKPIISLTTDFGHDDPYVGMMKAVILGINPEASLVDLFHNVHPQDVETAGLLLAGACLYFPDGTIHLVVVDPGVGSARRCLAARTRRALFVAPDNGVLTAALAQDPADIVVELAERRYWRPDVSSTFQGRDVMGPVAAHLSSGVPVEALGPPLADWVRLAVAQPERRDDGTVAGHVVHVDHFGNLITDLRPGDLPPGQTEPVFSIRGQTVVGLHRYYAEKEELMALVGSTGHIEIALPRGNAAARLQARRGDVVYARRRHRGPASGPPGQ